MTYPPGSTPGSPYSSEPLPPPPNPPSAGGLSENTAAALSYVTFIPALIFLLLEPYNRSKFIRFHSIQCIALSVVSFALHVVLMFIPVIGWIISILLSLAFFILWIVCIIKASRGEWFKLPVIGDFALTQASQTGPR